MFCLVARWHRRARWGGLDTSSGNTSQDISFAFSKATPALYYTLQKLHALEGGGNITLLCLRCSLFNGSLLHMLWRCPKLHRYWEKNIHTLKFTMLYWDNRNAQICAIGNNIWWSITCREVHDVHKITILST